MAPDAYSMSQRNFTALVLIAEGALAVLLGFLHVLAGLPWWVVVVIIAITGPGSVLWIQWRAAQMSPATVGEGQGAAPLVGSGAEGSIVVRPSPMSWLAIIGGVFGVFVLAILLTASLGGVLPLPPWLPGAAGCLAGGITAARLIARRRAAAQIPTQS